VPLPVFDVVERATGVTASEINGQYLDRVALAAADCLVARGYEVRPSDFMTADSRGAPAQLGGFAAQALARFETPDGDQRQPSAELTPIRQLAVGECQEAAQSRISDPLSGLLGWFAAFGPSVVDRSQSDRRLPMLRADFADCLVESGVQASSPDELYQQLVNATNDVVEEFASGAITRSEAQAELEQLAERERSSMSQLTPCITRYDNGYSVILADAQAFVLDQQGSALDEQIELLGATYADFVAAG
jgi:hypothetical protein